MVEKHKQLVAKNLNKRLSKLSDKDLELFSTSLSGLIKVISKLD